jgi:hypothetical protein
MKAKIILGLGLVALLASGLNAGEIRYEREHRVCNNHEKSHKHIKRDHHRDRHYTYRSHKRDRYRETRVTAYELAKAIKIIQIATSPHRTHERHLAFGGYRY